MKVLLFCYNVKLNWKQKPQAEQLKICYVGI